MQRDRRYTRSTGGQGAAARANAKKCVRQEHEMKHRPYGRRAAAAAAARPAVQTEEWSSADTDENSSFGHEVQQAQELLRAQNIYLQRKASRKLQRQQRKQRQQVQQQRQRILRLQREKNLLERELQKQLEQLQDQRQQKARQWQHGSGQQHQRQQKDQQAYTQHQQWEKEQLPEQTQRSAYGKNMDEAGFSQKTGKGNPQGRMGRCAANLPDKGVDLARLEREAHSAGSGSPFKGKQHVKRKLVTLEVRRRKSACLDTVRGSDSEEDEGETGDTKRKGGMYPSLSCTDEYLLPREAKNRRSLQNVFRDSGESKLLRAEEMERQRLEDERELLYLERQLGFSAPGISEEKKKKMISKELAALGFDDDFLACLDATLESPEKASPQQQVRQQCEELQRHRRQHPKQEHQHCAGQQRRIGEEGESYETEGDSPRPSSRVDFTERAKGRTREAAAGKHLESVRRRAYKDDTEEEEVGLTNEKSADRKARVATRPLLARDTVVPTATDDPASRTKRVPRQLTTKQGKEGAPGSFDTATGKHAHSRVRMGSPLSSAAEECARQRLHFLECSSSSAHTDTYTTASGAEHEAKEEFTKTTSDGEAEKGRQAAASEGEKVGEGSGALTTFSGESDCRTAQRSSRGECYVPPHKRRRLQLEKHLAEQQQQGEGYAVFSVAADVVEGLQLRLRGLLNRTSEGNVELVLQQMVAAMKETSTELASSMEKGQNASETEQKKQQRLRRVHEYFMRRLCEAVATLLIENAIENKFSVAALIATQTALCCSLSAVFDTQLLRQFLEALGRCFRRHYRTVLLLDSSGYTGSSASHSGQSSSVHLCTGENSSDVAVGAPGKEREFGEGTQDARYWSDNGLRERQQSAASTAAMYARHVIAAICFLFDYGALPATVYLQLLERLTVTRASEARTEDTGIQCLDTGGNDETSDSTTSATVDRNSTVAGLCAAVDARRTTQRSAVLSEFQVECLLLALRLGGRRLRSESPELFREAWIHLMARAAPALHAEEHVSRAALHAASVPPDEEGWTVETVGGRAAGSSDVPAGGGHVEEREKDHLQQLKLRLQQRAAAQPATERHVRQRKTGAEDTQNTTTNGRLRFLVHELQELRNNKSKSCALSSSAAAQDTMRRWLQTSPTLRSAAPVGASSNCCAALLESLDGITWRGIEEGNLSSATVDPPSSALPRSCVPARGRGACVSATASATQAASQAKAAAAAVLRELESSSNVLRAAGKAAMNTCRQDAVAKLAAKLRFHTENQKAIFSSLMSASDPNDAVQRVLETPRNAVNPKRQVVDVVAVILHSCLQEKTFNPFYAVLLARLCGRCCCASRTVRPQPPDGSTALANRETQKAHFNAQSIPLVCSASKSGTDRLCAAASSVPFSACALPTPGGARRQVAVEKLLGGCTCYTLPQKEAVKYTRVLHRGVAAQISAAHGFPLRRLLHLAKLEAFLIRLGILELRLIRFLNFEEAAKEPDAGHMGLAGKFGAFLKELCTELLCDQSQASVPIPPVSSSSPASAGTATPSPLPLFFSVCNLPDIREALLSVLEQQASTKTQPLKACTLREKNGSSHGRRLSTALVERVIWLLKEAPVGAGDQGIDALPD